MTYKQKYNLKYLFFFISETNWKRKFILDLEKQQQHLFDGSCGEPRTWSQDTLQGLHTKKKKKQKNDNNYIKNEKCEYLQLQVNWTAPCGDKTKSSRLSEYISALLFLQTVDIFKTFISASCCFKL